MTAEPQRPESEGLPATRHRTRPLYLLLAYLALGLGILGVFLPLLPTTPFLLVSAWAASRGSPKLHRWLYEHPRYGAALIAWETERAVPRSAKVAACVLMAISWGIMLWLTTGWVIPATAGLFMLGAAMFLLTRPEPRSLPPRDH